LAFFARHALVFRAALVPLPVHRKLWLPALAAGL